MSRLLTSAEIADLQSRQHISPDQVQPWLKVTDLGRQIIVFQKTDGVLLFTDATDLAQTGGLDQWGVNQQPNADLLTWDPATNSMVPSMPAIVQRAAQETAQQLASDASAVINYAGQTAAKIGEGVAKGAAEGAGSGTLFVLVAVAIVGYFAWKAHLV
jgi:hypothetical protein